MASSPISASSPASSPQTTPAPTRGRPSVQALLAELSDSDSEVRPAVQQSSRQDASKSSNANLSADDSSDEDLLVGGGRLANRLAGMTAQPTTVAAEQPVSEKAALEPFSNTEEDILREESTAKTVASTQPKKRLLLKRKRISDEKATSLSSPRPRSLSPQQNSPTPTRSASSHARSERSLSPESQALFEEPAPTATKSRFQALVEKARQERKEREAAEQAEKAARSAQETLSIPAKGRQRGSSPADDSEEDSDQSNTAAARRLTKAARPTRKASKKAKDEISRETQRMTRNMQLAHEARTKKKFTKESFFATFSGLLPSVTEATESQKEPQTLPASPSSSDTEQHRADSTPPTSPLRSPALNKTMESTVFTDTTPLVAQPSLDGKEDSFEDILASRRTEQGKPDVLPNNRTPKGETPPEGFQTASVFTAHGIATKTDSDSDSDIEVVYSKADRRKYAAFENIPKKKAKEMPSHLALRSLAHVRQERDKKSVMSRANMDVSLLKAARRQACEERKEKIDKLRAAGVVIQTADEKEQDQEELENLVERARQQDEEIRKREKELAKKDGTYVKDELDDDDSDDDDEDFQDEDQNEQSQSDSDDEDAEADDEGEDEDEQQHHLVDDVAEESASEDEEQRTAELDAELDTMQDVSATPIPTVNQTKRKARIVLDDDDDDEEDTGQSARSPAPLPSAWKTPQSILRSTRKVIPGLHHSDDLPIGLTQAFAATMADSQTQGEEATQRQDSMDFLRDLPSPHIDLIPRLNRLESMDMISESVPSTQTQPLELDLNLSQSQRVPESPSTRHQIAASQIPFDLTQDAGYSFSPFAGNRFDETPRREPHSTEETVILAPGEHSPSLQRKGRLQRGRLDSEEHGNDGMTQAKTAFQVMNKAARRKMMDDFNKKKSEARQAVDEAAEESDDEYAGLGGASDDDSNDEENEEDRRMIDQDTQVGRGDEAKLAKLHADREREDDEAAVNKMMKDITTGALRRKRGAVDDLDLSDEEDAVSRRREAKRREFAKMRRELLKDEAVGKIADDKKKEAFLKSIEDHDDDDNDEDGIDLDQQDTLIHVDTQEESQQAIPVPEPKPQSKLSKPLQQSEESQLNQLRSGTRRTKAVASRKPGTLAEIRESVSFLIEEPDSQAGVIDLGLSDSEEEPEAYVNLDRHLRQAEADEDAMDDENADLGDFVVEDEEESSEDHDVAFKKPELPSRQGHRAPFSERRTKDANVIDRLSLLRQASSSSASGSNASSKMAFFSSRAGSGSLTNVPSLLRRATTNSSLGSMSGRENVSATGVVTSKTERGSAAQEKDFVRKGASTSRNAVNYQGRQSLKEEKMSARAGIMKKQQKKKGGGFLGSLFRGDTWG